MAPSARFTEDFAYEVLSVVGEIPEGTVADKRQILMVEHEHILKALTLRHIQEAKMAVREHIDNQEITILKNLKEQENDIQRKVPGRRN